MPNVMSSPRGDWTMDDWKPPSVGTKVQVPIQMLGAAGDGRKGEFRGKDANGLWRVGYRMASGGYREETFHPSKVYDANGSNFPR